MVSVFERGHVEAVVLVSRHSLKAVDDQLLKADIVVTKNSLALQNTVLLGLLGELSNCDVSDVARACLPS